MTEFRRDPVTHRWVVTDLVHDQDPITWIKNLKYPTSDFCPFCEGQENVTAPEIFALRQNSPKNAPGWETRVIPNRATDLQVSQFTKQGRGGIYDSQSAAGVHETVIETPKHKTLFSQLEPQEISKVLKTYQMRIQDLRKNSDLQSLVIFSNQGKDSPRMFQHTHSQILALPFINRTLQEKCEGAAKYFSFKSRCLYCDIIIEELRNSNRVVYENGSFVAWCPFSSRFPFEVCIASKEHQSEFSSLHSTRFHDLSLILKTVLQKIESVIGDIALNWVIHTAPLQSADADISIQTAESFHWHIEILPHALNPGGFEWGTDFYLSPLSPEICAKALREITV